MSEKICIWCSKSEQNTSFNTKAHIVPKSLGGKELCEFVCDSCNNYFGNKTSTNQFVEIAIKETFALSRAMLLKSSQLKNNKRYTSTFFKVNLEKNHLNIKYSYKLLPHFQEKMAILVKKGMYKILLESLAVKNIEEVLSSKFDFIRQYCRFNIEPINAIPLVYFYRSFGIIYHSSQWIKYSKFIFPEDNEEEYLLRNNEFIEVEFLGHVFGLVLTKNWRIHFSEYMKKSQEDKKKRFFVGYKNIKNWNDIDIPLCMFNDETYQDFIKSRNITYFK